MARASSSIPVVATALLTVLTWAWTPGAQAAPPDATTASSSEVLRPRLTAGSVGAQVTSTSGYAGLVPAADATWWGLVDNSYGTEAQQRGTVLRLELIAPQWRTRDGGAGSLTVRRSLSLSDPDKRLAFPLADPVGRVLTAADFDFEGLQRGRNGSFWLADQRRSVLVQVDDRGRVLRAPVPVPGALPAATQRGGPRRPSTTRAAGVQALAASADGRFLYAVAGARRVADTEPRRRVVSQFDLSTGRFTDRAWDYRTDTADDVVADAQLNPDGSLLVLERDDFEGDSAVVKRVYRVDLATREADGRSAKSLVADLLDLDNPDALAPAPGWGTDKAFSFGLRAPDSLAVDADGSLVIATGTATAPGSARRPGTPDRVELIRIDPTATAPAPTRAQRLLAHRGASGYRPEHTLAAYELAIRQCADLIEPDVVLSADGVPFVRHEHELGSTTDIAARPELAARRTTKLVHGGRPTGYFSEDYRAAELRTLRARERVPDLRPGSARFDGRYPVLSLAEVLDFARHSRTCAGEPVGVSPEMKNAFYFEAIGLPIPPALVAALRAAGMDRADAPVIVQSFEAPSLRQLDRLSDVRLLQLIGCNGTVLEPVDAATAIPTYRATSPAALAGIRTYADAIGPCKDVVIPRDPTGRLADPTTVTADARSLGLEVIVWTFRRENAFLPPEFRIGTDPAAPGDLAAEIRRFLVVGIDGYFTDNPDIGSSVVLT